MGVVGLGIIERHLFVRREVDAREGIVHIQASLPRGTIGVEVAVCRAQEMV